MGDAPETPSFTKRLAWHAHLAWRASRMGAVLGLVGAFLLHLLLPVRGGWIAGLVAAACGAIALGLVAVGGRGDQLPPATLAVGPALEKVGAADQVAHGLARAALVLGGFALGLWLGGLVSALRA